MLTMLGFLGYIFLLPLLKTGLQPAGQAFFIGKRHLEFRIQKIRHSAKTLRLRSLRPVACRITAADRRNAQPLRFEDRECILIISIAFSGVKGAVFAPLDATTTISLSNILRRGL